MIYLLNKEQIKATAEAIKTIVDAGGTFRIAYATRHGDWVSEYIIRKYDGKYTHGEYGGVQHRSDDFSTLTNIINKLFDPKRNRGYGFKLLEAAGLDLDAFDEDDKLWYKAHLEEYTQRLATGETYPYWFNRSY